MTLPRLVTIPISHYGERARWALDWAGLDYDEEHHLQMFSWIAARSRGKRRFLPVLVTDDGVLDDSGLIVRWASDRSEAPLYPRAARERAEVEALDRRLAEAYGVASRLVAYDWFFRSLEVSFLHNAGRAARWQVRAMNLARAPVRAFAKSYLGVKPQEVRSAIAHIDRTFDEIAALLSDGRRFLFGDSFTAADLTFASMSAPNVIPDRYPVSLPPVSEIPADAAERVQRWRAHPAGAFVLRLYDERPQPRGRYQRELLSASHQR